MNDTAIQPEPPEPSVAETRAFWREMGKTMIRESLGTIDETAKQIIGVAGILEGLYFHAIAFGDLRGQVQGNGLLVYLAPVFLLLLSLVMALLVYFPERYRVNFNSSEASKLVYERVVASKLLALRLASLFLVLGVAAILVAAMAYLGG
jgi:hypothetical protein